MGHLEFLRPGPEQMEDLSMDEKIRIKAKALLMDCADMKDAEELQHGYEIFVNKLPDILNMVAQTFVRVTWNYHDGDEKKAAYQSLGRDMVNLALVELRSPAEHLLDSDGSL